MDALGDRGASQRIEWNHAITRRGGRIAVHSDRGATRAQVSLDQGSGAGAGHRPYRAAFRKLAIVELPDRLRFEKLRVGGHSVPQTVVFAHTI